jgi:hypothetical protein
MNPDGDYVTHYTDTVTAEELADGLALQIEGHRRGR